jgi:acetoin utilization deacetylase AcuC-like enzyme
MTAAVRRAADAVGAPVGVVLEGGYDLGALAGSMAALMPVLVAATGPDDAVARHPLAEEAVRRLAPASPRPRGR